MCGVIVAATEVIRCANVQLHLVCFSPLLATAFWLKLPINFTVCKSYFSIQRNICLNIEFKAQIVSRYLLNGFHQCQILLSCRHYYFNFSVFHFKYLRCFIIIAYPTENDKNALYWVSIKSQRSNRTQKCPRSIQTSIFFVPTYSNSQLQRVNDIQFPDAKVCHSSQIYHHHQCSNDTCRCTKATHKL